MRFARLLVVTAVLALAGSAAARAAEPDVAGLIREFKGEAEPVKRSAEELAAAYSKVLASLLTDMGADDVGKRGNAQNEWSRICLRAGRPGAEDDRAAACQAMVPRLGDDTPTVARVWLIRQLQWIGKGESLNALVRLMDDKDTLVRESARRAVQVNPSPEAGPALLASLAKADARAWRIACINALAARKDAAATAAIAKLLADKDEPTALAAADGLGKIGGQASAQALAAALGSAPDKLKAAILDAYLCCADQFVAAGRKEAALPIYEATYAPAMPERTRIAALRGLVIVKGEDAIPLLGRILDGPDAKMRGIALSFMREIPGTGATRAMAAMLPKLPPAAQADVLTELGNRADPTTKPAVLTAAKSEDPAVKVAAIRALGGVGDATDIPALVQTASAEGPQRDAARFALDHLRGEAVDRAMVNALAGSDAKVRPELLRSLGARRSAAAVPAMARYAEDADGPTATEAIRGLETLGDEKNLGLLVSLITKTQKDDVRGAAERALVGICARASDKDAVAAPLIAAVGGASGQAKAALVRVLGRVGGQKALEPVKTALKDADAAVQDAAIRSLSEWPDGSAAADLLTLAQTEAKQTNQVLALRGYVRLISVGDRPVPEKVKMCQQALEAAKRPDEKRLILGPLAECRTIDALKLAAPLMDETGVKEEAAQASVRIARDIGGKLPPEVKDAMEKALTVTRNERVKKDAQDVLKKIAPAKK
jgi:HEAT repeat protein